MKNRKLYDERRKEHEKACELSTFEYWNGFSIRPTYHMQHDDEKRLKEYYNNEVKYANAFTLPEFKNRAIIIPRSDGSLTLESYYTEICEIHGEHFTKLWYGYSNTSLKHINIFRARYNMPPLTKYEWIMME